MPNKTRMLDHGGFVHSPKVPMEPAFAGYLHQADQLYDRWQRAFDQWNQSPFSLEALAEKKSSQQEFDVFVAAFADKYTLKFVERDPRFLTLAHFFSQDRPIREGFSVLHCTVDMPLHTVCSFQSRDELERINAALDEKIPLPWWQNGPLNHPCYLFGQWIWELKPAEIGASEKGIFLLFEQTKEKESQRLDKLRSTLSHASGTESRDFIPETVRVHVWRRDGGKCAKCGSRDSLEFRRLLPANRGGGNTADNWRLLCGRCHQKQLTTGA
jgi:hypothetical protein